MTITRKNKLKDMAPAIGDEVFEQEGLTLNLVQPHD